MILRSGCRRLVIVITALRPHRRSLPPHANQKDRVGNNEHQQHSAQDGQHNRTPQISRGRRRGCGSCGGCRRDGCSPFFRIPPCSGAGSGGGQRVRREPHGEVHRPAPLTCTNHCAGEDAAWGPGRLRWGAGRKGVKKVVGDQLTGTHDIGTVRDEVGQASRRAHGHDLRRIFSSQSFFF